MDAEPRAMQARVRTNARLVVVLLCVLLIRGVAIRTWVGPSPRRTEEEVEYSPEASASPMAEGDAAVSLPVIIGVSAGGAVVLAALIAVCVCVLRRRALSSENDYQSFGEWRKERRLNSVDLLRRNSRLASSTNVALDDDHDSRP